MLVAFTRNGGLQAPIHQVAAFSPQAGSSTVPPMTSPRRRTRQKTTHEEFFRDTPESLPEEDVEVVEPKKKRKLTHVQLNALETNITGLIAVAKKTMKSFENDRDVKELTSKSIFQMAKSEESKFENCALYFSEQDVALHKSHDIACTDLVGILNPRVRPLDSFTRRQRFRVGFRAVSR
jgi:hypothetical protein